MQEETQGALNEEEQQQTQDDFKCRGRESVTECLKYSGMQRERHRTP